MKSCHPIWVAAEVRASAAYAHLVKALDFRDDAEKTRGKAEIRISRASMTVPTKA